MSQNDIDIYIERESKEIEKNHIIIKGIETYYEKNFT